MVLRRHVPVYLLLSTCLLVACGDTHDRPVLTTKSCKIINGTLDNSVAHKAVVYLQMQESWWTTACTGTLIAPRVVLTAGHCINDISTSNIDVGFGTYSSSLSWRSISEKWVHPSYTDDPTNDIAMVRLSSDAPSDVVPIPNLPAGLALVDADIDVVEVEFVGFGTTETGSSGTKLRVTDLLGWICENMGGCDFGYPRYAMPNTICTDQSPGGTCTGDSGGPGFVWRSGQEYVASITSYGINEQCTLWGCHTKVDRFEAEILSFVGGVDGSPCSSPTQCDSGNCEDGVCCATACPGVCNVCDAAGSLGSCVAAPNGYPCPDADLCDGEETCQGGSCAGSAPLDCDDDEPCTNDSCNSSSGCVHNPVANGTDCSDGNLCNGEEACQGGECQSTGAPPCDDDDPCTNDTCHPVNGCQHSGVADGTQCFDDDVCNGAEICQGGNCLPGTPIDCDDSNPCTNDNCDPATGCFRQDYPDNMLCDDFNACTGDGRCQAGVCQQGNPVDCDDLNACTNDSCAPGAGCQHPPVADGTACGGGLCGDANCSSGECVGSGARDCDDANPCTNDGCDPATGCIHSDVPDGAACEDGDPCTVNDSCQAGVCSTGQPASCDDQNPCTTDSCTASGCQHAPVADGTGCGGGMCGAATCQAGECVSSDPESCDDDDPCTRDWCDPATGCQHQKLPQGYECGECMACVDDQCVLLADCGGDGSGCGCGVVHRPGSAIAVLLLAGLALFPLVSRRRRR